VVAFVLLLWITSFSICRGVMEAFVSFSEPTTIFDDWLRLFNQTLQEQSQFSNCVARQERQCWTKLNSTTEEEQSRFRRVQAQNQQLVDDRESDLALAARLLTDTIVSLNAWNQWIAATNLDQPVVIADAQLLIQESANCSAAEADLVRSWIQQPVVDSAVLYTANLDLAAEQESTWSVITAYGAARLQYDQEYLANKTQVSRVQLELLNLQLQQLLECVVYPGCAWTPIYTGLQDALVVSQDALDQLWHLVDEVNGQLVDVNTALEIAFGQINGLSDQLEVVRDMLDVVDLSHLIAVPDFSVDFPTPFDLNALPEWNMNLDPEWNALNEHLALLRVDWNHWTVEPIPNPLLVELLDPFADYDPPAFNLSLLFDQQAASSSDFLVNSRLLLAVDTPTAVLDPTVNATIVVPDSWEPDLVYSLVDLELDTLEGKYDFGAVVNLFTVLTEFLQVADLVWRLFRTLEIALKAWTQTLQTPPRARLWSATLDRTRLTKQQTLGMYGLVGSGWLVAVVVSVLLSSDVGLWVTVMVGGLVTLISIVHPLPPPPVSAFLIWVLTITLVAQLTQDAVLITAVAVGGVVMLVSIIGSLQPPSLQPNWSTTLTHLIRSSWQQMLRVFVVSTLLLIVLLALLSILFNVYLPLYHNFQQGCSATGSVGRIGTLFSTNLHALVFNYATWTTNGDLVSKLQVFDQDRLTRCAQQQTVTAADQNYFVSTLAVIQTNTTNTHYQLLLLDRCLQPAAVQLANVTATAFAAAGAVVYPWAAAWLQLTGEALAQSAFLLDNALYDRRYTLQDGLAICENLAQCPISCVGPDSDWLDPFAWTAACQLEGYMHGNVLQFLGAIVLFIGLNLARWSLQHAVLRSLWRTLTPVPMVTMMIARPFQVDERVDDPYQEPTNDAKQQAVAVAIRQYKYVTWLYWLAVLVYTLLPVIFLLSL
jgi:hypothetical protein